MTFALLWALAAIFAIRVLHSDFPAALLIGLALAILHWVALFVHHFGHWIAARSTGYPMIGVLLWWALATSLYPRDEPDLPASIHVRRAIGGPIASFAFALGAGVLAWAMRANAEVSWVLAAFVALDSFIIFGIGSLVPLGFNDGSTLIRWSRAQRKDRAA